MNSDGDVVEHYRYSAYGKFKIYDSSWNELTQSSIGNPYFFTARRFDSEFGLYYYRARMYSAEIGRFLQVDPIKYFITSSLYCYAANNPISLEDPMGLAPFTNNSDKPIPYKPEHEENQCPRIAEPGETVDADGIYSPLGTKKPVVIKIPNNSKAVLEKTGKLTVKTSGLAKYLKKGQPRQLTPGDLIKQEFRNWPDPYTGRHWPYELWIISKDKSKCKS